MHRVALHNQRVVRLLHRFLHFIPLLLLNEYRVVRWCRGQQWHALGTIEAVGPRLGFANRLRLRTIEQDPNLR